MLTTRSKKDRKILSTFIDTGVSNQALLALLKQDPASGQFWLGYGNHKWDDYQRVSDRDAAAIIDDPQNAAVYPAAREHK